MAACEEVDLPLGLTDAHLMAFIAHLAKGRYVCYTVHTLLEHSDVGFGE